MRNRITIDEAIEDGWLALRRDRWPCHAISVEAGCSVRRVQLGISAARRREAERHLAPRSVRPISPVRPTPPRLDLAFGSSCKPLAVLTCEDVHHGPLPLGTACCCAVCHRSGRDHHPALVLDARDIPPAEAKPAAKPKAKPTRRQRRAKVA